MHEQQYITYKTSQQIFYSTRSNTVFIAVVLRSTLLFRNPQTGVGILKKALLSLRNNFTFNFKSYCLGYRSIGCGLSVHFRL